MEKQRTILMIAAALLAVFLPIGMALYLAWSNALDGYYALATTYANDIVTRTDGTSDQVDAGFKRLSRLPPRQACSQAEMDIMRDIDLSSSYVQAIGRTEAGRIICSSLGLHAPPLALGPVQLVTPRGVALRLDARFPFAGSSSFAVLERDGFAAIIHKSLPIDATTDEADASLATFSRPSNTIVASRGLIKKAWLDSADREGIVRFVDDSHVVVVVRSSRYYTGAIAAIPRHYLGDRVWRSSRILLPLGLAAGIGLVFVLAWLVKVQTSMPAMLKAALAKDEFFLVYQPIVELQSGRWVGAEALIRWRRATGEMVRPDLFIPAAEDAGMIRLVSQRVATLAARDLAGLIDIAPDFHVSINLSSDDMQSAETLALLERLVADSGLPASSIHVEATERGFMRTDTSQQMIRDIRSLGFRIAIDDFGTGYSSLSYLGTFEIDYLKIDKSFVDTIGQGAVTSQVIPHIIEMARSLGLQMIAEGIESEEQATYLREHAVQYGQGWLYSKPLPVEALLQGLRKRAWQAAAHPPA